MKNTLQSKPSVLAVQEALAREPRVYDFVQYCYESKGKDAAMAIELSASDFSPEFHYPGRSVVVVLITLPARLLGDLDAIASSEPSIYNEYSPDLLENYSYIAFKGNEFEVRLDLWRLHRFPRAIHDGVIFFTFIAADRVAVGQVEASEELEEVSQGACISSGSNYKPGRDWSEAAITAAQNEPEAPNDTVVTIRNYAKYLGERERRQ
jgi:hypothetical protein